MANMIHNGITRRFRKELTELHQRCLEKKKYTVDAQEKISQLSEDHAALMKAWKRDYKAYGVSFHEYYDQFRFPQRSKEEKAAYMSTSSMFRIYRKYVSPSCRAVLKNKERFLTEYSRYVSRRWCVWKEGEDFGRALELLSSVDVIAKPLTGTHGAGVQMFAAGTTDLKRLSAASNGDSILLEEVVCGHPALEAFHPQSLNTIRVVFFSDGRKAVPMWAVLRTGSGDSCVDNTHGGGISALIDLQSGIVVSDGQHDGQVCAVHPDSGIPFRGFQIPSWDLILHQCREATLLRPDTYFVGWDIAVLPDGQIEFIEGNHGPDVDGVQTLLGHGLKPEIMQTIRELKIIS